LLGAILAQLNADINTTLGNSISHFFGLISIISKMKCILSLFDIQDCMRIAKITGTSFLLQINI